MLKNWEECPAPGKKRKAPAPLEGVWKTRSVFWDLRYWPILKTPHCLDVMHVTKNMCESLLGTLLNMPERTKDWPKVRNDLKFMKIRAELHGGDPKDADAATDDDELEGTEGRHKGKRPRRPNITAPLCASR